MPRHGEVRQNDRHSAAFTNDPCVDSSMRSVNLHEFSPEEVQQLECPVGWLGDSVQIQHSESAVKRNGRKKVFRKDISEGPEAVTPGQSARLHDDPCNECGGERLV